MKRKIAIFISGSLMFNGSVSTTSLFADTGDNNIVYVDDVLKEDDIDIPDLENEVELQEINEVSEDTGEASKVSESTEEASEVSENTEETSEVLENTEETSEVLENTEEASEVSENTEETSEVLENTEETSEVLENTEKTSEVLENTEEASEVLENTEETSDILGNTQESETEQTTEKVEELIGNDVATNLNLATGRAVNSCNLSLDDGNIVISETGYSIDGNFVDYTGASYVITQSDSSAENSNTITVESGTNEITLKGVNMLNYFTTPFNITTSGDTTILLDGENTLRTTTTKGFAGLQKNGADTGKLIIDKVSSDDTDVLIAKGGSYGAGIGGGASGFANNIEIKGGTVNATGGDGGSGIGGGYAGYASNITISGGNVTATGKNYGAGIGGGGYAKSESDVTISGGNVVATGGDKGAGIGGGVDSNVSNIVISGGNVVATGGDCGAGIGGGFGGVVSEVYIGLAFVKATGGANAQDIGNGADEIELDNVFNNETDKKIVHLYKIDGLTEGETITVDGNAIVVPKLLDNDTNRYFYLTEGIHTFVTSKGTKSIVFNSVTNEFDEAIDVANGDIIIKEKGYTYNGTFYSYTGDYIIVQSTKVVRDHRIAVDEGSHKITLKGVFIVHPSLSPFAIRTSGDTTILLDGENVLNASQTSGLAGLQKDDRNTGKLIIDKVSSDKKDSLAAFGGKYAAGIGGANKYDASDIEIRGGTINAIGGKYAAGIGSGYWGDASNITISGGNITANFEKQSLHVGAAGIGASWGGGASNIVISGGNIQAFGSGGAGIGGGTYDANRKGSSALNVSKIYITGGNILAIGKGSSSAGIGAGDFSAASEIYISGGFVYAAGPRAVGSCSRYESEDVYNNETDKKPVYAYKIEGLSEGQTISIDGKEIVVPESLRYAGNSGNRYVYLTGEMHTIVTPSGKKVIAFNSATKEFYEAIDIANGNLTISETGYTYGDTFYDYTGGVYTIIQSNPETATTNTITVEGGSNQITLNGVNMINNSLSPFNITTSGDTTVLLDGENILKTNSISRAGLQKDGTDTGKLIIDKVSSDDTDVLTANGGVYAAGIGGGGSSGNNIEIKGGTINATGGGRGAGIGCGYGESVSNIIISGGIVNATGRIGGAGIGTGASDDSNHSKAEKIYITGGTVVATADSGGTRVDGAGIGGGEFSTASEIYISGGNVKAISNLERSIGSGNGATPMGSVLNNATDNIAVSELKINADTVPTDLSILTGSNSYTYSIDGIKLFDDNGEKYFNIYIPINDAENGEYSTITYNGKTYKVQVNESGNLDVITDVDVPADLLSISKLTYGDSLLPEGNKQISVTVSGNDTKQVIDGSAWKVKKDDGEFEDIAQDATAQMAEYTYKIEFADDSKYIFDKNMKLPGRTALNEKCSTLIYTGKKITTQKIVVTELNIPIIDNLVYSATRTLNDIALPSDENGQWVWVDSTEVPNVYKTSYMAKYIPNNLDNTYYLISGWSSTEGVIYKEIGISVSQKYLSSDNVSIEYETAKYDGMAKEPKVTVEDEGLLLANGIDYDFAYSDNTNAGTAKVIVTYKGNYGETVEKTFEITPKMLNGDNVSIEYTTTEYDTTEKEPKVTITDGEKVLAQGVDYEVEYTENINVGTATVTVNYKGNYTGVVTKTFEITAKELNSDNVNLEYTTTEYDGTEKEPKVTVTDGEKVLVLSVDYEIEYIGNTNVGTATVTVTYKGNYTGVGTKLFEITVKELNSDNINLEYSTTSYDGTTKEPKVIITDGERVLVQGVDYEVLYMENRNVGTATVTVTYKGNYTGVGTKTFEITAKKLNSDNVNLEYTTIEYDGMTKEPKVIVKDGEKTLAQGVDYEVGYTGNTKAGTATVTITYKGNYTGVGTKTFEITAKELNSNNVNLEYTTIEYNGTAKEPKVTVKDGEKALVFGVDYEVGYTGNTKAGTATVTVTYKGNYTGVGTKTFEITAKELNSNNVNLEYTTIEYDGTAKEPKVTVKDGEKVLVLGVDYEIEYSNNINLGTATVIVNCKGNYTGTVTNTFEIVRKELNSDNVNLEYTTIEYDGTAKEPKVTVTDGEKVLVLGVDYEIEYSNNINLGTATVIVNCKGNYTGTVTNTFEIVRKELNSDNVNLEYTTIEYDGTAKEPKVTVTDGEKVLVQDVDYEVEYTRNTNAGIATIIVNCKGNYTGTVTKTLEITAKELNSDNVSLEYTTIEYDGTAKEPKVTVTDGEKVLVQDVDYEVEYTRNTNAGTATVTVTYKGNYTGTVIKTFEITAKFSGGGSARRYTITNDNETNDTTGKKDDELNNGTKQDEVPEEKENFNNDEIFDDLDAAKWAKERIERLARGKILLGLGNKKFAPNSDITRADTAVIIKRALKFDSGVGKKFTDVSPESYYYDVVTSLSKEDIVYGYDDDTFAPTEKITREDAFCIIERAISYYGIETNSGQNNLSKFTDSSEISEYAKSAISKLIELNIIEGNNGRINPKNNITRAEMAVIVDKVISLLNLGNK